MKGRQIHGYVPRTLHKRLQEYAAKKGVSESSVTHAALSRYLNDSDDTPLMMRQLQRLERSVERLHREANVRAEAFAVYVQMWFAHTPRLEESERPHAQRSAFQRFREYSDHVSEKIAEGGSFVAALVREDLADDDELNAAAAGQAGSDSR